MANLITALQQKPSVSSANYEAEFWCLNHYEMLGTGGAWSPKARPWLGFQSVEGHLGLAPLGGALEWLLQMVFSGDQRIREFQAGRELKNHLV